MSNLKALIFDFDGLILDTETPEVEGWRIVFRRYGVEFPDSYWMNAIGRGADQIEETPRQLLARLVTRKVDPEAIRAEHHREFYRIVDQQGPRPGIVEILAQASAAGIPMGVASSSRHDWVDGYLSKLGLAHYFEAVTCADDVARAKPFPDLYLLACERLGVPPRAALALEDSPNGIAAARAAGVLVVTYPNPLTSQMDVSAADRRVDDLRQVSLDDLRAWHASGQTTTQP